MVSDKIRELIQKSAAGNISFEERQTLQHWLNTASFEETEAALAFHETLNAETLASADTSAVDANIQNLISNQPAIQRSLTVQLLRWSAAAVFMLCAGIAFWLYSDKKQPAIESPLAAAEQRYKNDVQPGTDKAVLTTSNGDQFLLNNTSAGLNAPEGVRVQDGLVDYRDASSSTASQINTISIPRSAQYKLILSDGSKVWLNAQTTLKFPSAFKNDLREVELTGEAYFEVAKNADAPFIVKTNGMQVRVLGTHFNVNAYDASAVKTSLEEGSVQLEAGDAKSVLVPGKKGVLTQGKFNVSDADLNADLGWKNGLFVFNKTDIKTVMQQFERWYDVDVAYESGVPDKKFVGDLQRSLTLVQALKILELSGVHFTVQDKKITVLNK